MGNLSPSYCCSNSQGPIDKKVMDLQDLSQLDYNVPETYSKLQEFSLKFTQDLEMNPEISQLIYRIITTKQGHLLLALRNIQTKQKKIQFLKEINSRDLEVAHGLFHKATQRTNLAKSTITPCHFMDIDILSEEMRAAQFQIGLEAIKRGEVQVVLLAGGSSNRFSSVKFLKEIPFYKKSLIELMFIRLKRIVQLTEMECPFTVFIMCNGKNYHEIKAYLIKNSYFGFPARNVQQVIQTQTPIVSLDGQVILDSNLEVVVYPRGTAEILQVMNKKQVQGRVFGEKTKYLCVSGLQNILEKPCDPFFLGQMISSDVDIASKCVDPLNEKEPMMRYAKVNNHIKCIQPQILMEKSRTDKDIRLLSSPIAMNSVIFKTQYLKKLSQPSHLHKISNQIHSAIRKFSYMDIRREVLNVSEQCYVFQNHLGDLFFETEKVLILKVTRDEDYAPIITENEEYSIYSGKAFLDKVYQKRRRDPESTTLRLFSDFQ